MLKIRLLVISNSNIFRGGLASLIKPKSNIDVISVDNNASQAVKAAKAHKPHVVLAGIEFFEASDIELIPRIREVVPDTYIIVVTHSRRIANFLSAVKAGATGYISKENSFESIIKTITLAAEGKFIVDQPIATTVAVALQCLDVHRHQANPEHVDLLTKRERMVLALMAQANSNKEIAEALFTSTNTVKAHVHSIMQKLEAHSRLEATICAIEEDLQYSEDGIGMKQK